MEVLLPFQFLGTVWEFVLILLNIFCRIPLRSHLDWDISFLRIYFIDDSISLPVISFRLSIFYFFSVLVVYMLLGIYSFLPSCLICWHIFFIFSFFFKFLWSWMWFLLFHSWFYPFGSFFFLKSLARILSILLILLLSYPLVSLILKFFSFFGEKFINPPSVLNDRLASLSISHCRFFPFSAF